MSPALMVAMSSASRSHTATSCCSGSPTMFVINLIFAVLIISYIVYILRNN